MAQRYTHTLALERMEDGTCPECGKAAEEHESTTQFWLRQGSCSLLPKGVEERIDQHREDLEGQS